MATSVDDLLTALDHETASNSSSDPRDAALALDWCNRLLTYLRSAGIAADIAPRRDDVARRLAEACADAAIAFEPGPGRHSDLTAVTHDAVRCLGGDLTDSDRWTVATRLAAPSRRWAAAIATSGPYADVPQLLSVTDRSSELLRVATASPPDLAELHAHDLPIPTTLRHPQISQSRAIVEATANLAAEFRLRGREAMTVRELLAVCHVATRVASYVEIKTHGATTIDGSVAANPSNAWHAARDTISLFADAACMARVRPAPSRVMTAAARVEIAVRRAAEASAERASVGDTCAPATDGECADAARIMRFLHQLGGVTEIELARIQPMIFVPHGPRPLHESRVGEWLRNRTFAAQPPDLIPAFQALRHAANRSIDRTVAVRDVARRVELAVGPNRDMALGTATMTL